MPVRKTAECRGSGSPDQARGGAVRDPARDRRPGVDARAADALPARRRTSPHRRRARALRRRSRSSRRPRCSAARFSRIQFTPEPRSERPRRPRGSSAPTSTSSRTEAWARLLQLPARRRDQPRARERCSRRCSRVMQERQGDDRPHDPQGSRPVPSCSRRRNPIESEGTYPAARGRRFDRVHAQGARRLPIARRGAHRRRAASLEPAPQLVGP